MRPDIWKDGRAEKIVIIDLKLLSGTYFRYILDNPQLVRGRRVLDVGSGSGACATAEMKSGAVNATANGIDPGILKSRQLCKICLFHLQSEITVFFPLYNHTVL